MKTLIVGGVAGGASAAARLRRLDENAEIIIFERGGFVSFANCGLPYFIGGSIEDKSKLTLQTPESFRARFNVDVRIFSEVIRVSPDKKLVTVRNTETGDTYEEGYDKLILSPGASPFVPPISGRENEGVFTLRNIPDTMKIKEYISSGAVKSALVAGGGYIGVEMAENLFEAGLSVTVAELSDHLIAPLDYDMAADVHNYLAEKGVSVITGKSVNSIEKDGGSLDVTVGGEKIKTDMVLISVGVRPDTAFLEGSGVALNGRGAIITDRYMRTSVPDIYAAGDAAEITEFVTGNKGYIPLAGPANRQGRIIADNICGGESTYEGTQGSAVLKIFDMTVGTTGLNEKTASLAGIDYDKTYIFSAPHASYYQPGRNMSIKVLWEKKTLRILGAQAVGYEGVDKRMDVISSAIRFGAKITDLASLELCYAPPFGSAKDPVNMIGFVAENIITGKMKQFFWHDVASLPRDGSVTLLDVRTVTEYARGNIEGFKNIPLDSLREHLSEIPRGKKVYVHCHSGLRSYIACRILTGAGYDCYNLAGGWRLYEAVAHSKTVKPYICTECK